VPSHSRALGGDPQAAGRARQRLKLAAIGYVNARHGMDADADLLRAGVLGLCRAALEFVDSLPGARPKSGRGDLSRRGDCETLKLAAIAYVSARHGIDADVGMAREGLAILCQAAIGYVESLPDEDVSKRAGDPRMQIGNGARP